MRIFDTMEDLIDHLAVEYPKSKGKTLASWQVSELLMLTAVYEEEDLIHGFFIYKDPTREFKWVLIDNLHADLSTRYYIEYIQEMQEAIALFEFLELFEDEDEGELPKDEIIKEDEIGFYEDLD